MTAPTPAATDPQRVDPERPRVDASFDKPSGYSGQGYTLGEEMAAATRPDAPPLPRDTGNLPPDAGQRAWTDPRSGEVHGSGTGIGGGSSGEDFDSSGASGDSYPITGGEHSNGSGEKPG